MHKRRESKSILMFDKMDNNDLLSDIEHKSIREKEKFVQVEIEETLNSFVLDHRHVLNKVYKSNIPMVMTISRIYHRVHRY